MMYLQELIRKNGHKLIRWNEGKAGQKYVSVFDYSVSNGGTYDGFRYYNRYYVDITGENDGQQ